MLDLGLQLLVSCPVPVKPPASAWPPPIPLRGIPLSMASRLLPLLVLIVITVLDYVGSLHYKEHCEKLVQVLTSTLHGACMLCLMARGGEYNWPGRSGSAHPRFLTRLEGVRRDRCLWRRQQGLVSRAPLRTASGCRTRWRGGLCCRHCYGNVQPHLSTSGDRDARLHPALKYGQCSTRSHRLNCGGTRSLGEL